MCPWPFEHTFDTFPRERRAGHLDLGPGGTLTTEAPTVADDADATIDAYRRTRRTAPRTTCPTARTPGGGSRLRLAVARCRGTRSATSTPPLAADPVLLGLGSADLWLRSSEADTDLQVTLTEVRPDGLETYVQSGWL